MWQALSKTVVVITGVSSRMGRAAVKFAEKGATVMLAARREKALHEIARKCRQRSGRSLVVPTDVTDKQQVKNLSHRTAESFGRIVIAGQPI